MSENKRSDALVFFGATGDLAYKKIFPALQAMVRCGHLTVPIIGVAKAGWGLDQLKERARKSLEDQGGVDEDAFAKLASLLRYVDGDYGNRATFEAVRKELGDAAHPVHYLAIPPTLFATVVQALSVSGCADGARVVVEKPFGRDLPSARRLNATLHSVFPEESIFRIDHFLGKEPVAEPPLLPVRQRVPRADLEPQPRRERADHDGRGLRRSGPREVLRGGRRDPRRGSEPPAPGRRAARDGASGRQRPRRRSASAKANAPEGDATRSIPRTSSAASSRATGRGRRRAGLAGRDLRRDPAPIETWRWAGVPFFIRAGKCLPVTATEVLVELKSSAAGRLRRAGAAAGNYFRFRLSPEVVIALGARAKVPGEAMTGEHVELVARHQSLDEMAPYERLLGDAIEGDQRSSPRGRRRGRVARRRPGPGHGARRSTSTSPEPGGRQRPIA